MRNPRSAILISALALAASACSGSVSLGGLDLESLESAIVEIGDEQRADLGPWSADCTGAPEEAEAGDTFTCTATDAGGTEYEVTVTATDDEGNVDISF